MFYIKNNPEMKLLFELEVGNFTSTALTDSYKCDTVIFPPFLAGPLLHHWEDFQMKYKFVCPLFSLGQINYYDHSSHVIVILLFYLFSAGLDSVMKKIWLC